MKYPAVRNALAISGLVTLAACSATPDDSKKPDQVATVHTAIAQSGAIAHQAQIYGTVENGPDGARAITAPAEAIVAQVMAANGTTVHAGQVVVILRPSPVARTELARAQIDFSAATVAYQRALRMRADGLISDADVETARTALASATAVRQNLGLANTGGVLRAPASGTVQGMTVRPGDQVAAGTALASIGSSADMRAKFGVDPVLARQIHAGQAIMIAAADGGADLATTVTGVEAQVDPATREVAVYARLPRTSRTPAAQFSNGQALRARIALGGTPTGGVVIPYAALLDDGGKTFVFVVSNGTAKRVDVQPGNSMADQIQILRGLAPGQKLVTEGGTALEDGMKVTEAGATKAEMAKGGAPR